MDVGRFGYAKSILIRPKLEWKYVSENQIFPLDFVNCYNINYQCSVLGGTMRNRCIPTPNTPTPKYIMRLKDPRVKGGFLEAATTYMVTDDLVVTRFSSISAIGILNKLKVPLKDVEHHEVTIGIEKALKILKASLRSNSTLTDVLLEEIIEKKKRARFYLCFDGQWAKPGIPPRVLPSPVLEGNPTFLPSPSSYKR
ncbi:hypothetical protein L6452_26881 [Arctium lappa]|uniref:Uncharacterized protein n=1 Tax=Arctium lappa TaxID=4217 RepID=A0ACB8ZVU0_ARCLA|nr:hypothetical protein L6452_26881 [Arctium lappa]